MYGNKLAIAVKHNGKVLREFNKDTVYLPFGAEYSIFIKNLDTVRASVKVMIDGKDIGDGTTFVVNGSSSIELERFLRAGNLNEGNRFKFIERTASVENHRGVGGEDGLVVIEYQFEKRVPKVEYVDHHIYHRYHDHWLLPRHRRPYWYGDDTYTVCNSGDSYGLSGGVSSNTVGSTVSDSLLNTEPKVQMKGKKQAMRAHSINLAHVEPQATLINDAGITVAGSKSDQQFHQSAWFATETEKFSLVLKLLGQVESGRAVRTAITVKHKQKCDTCGHVNKANAKFCANCGTALELV